MVEYMEGARSRSDTGSVSERVSADPGFVRLRRRFALNAGLLVAGLLVSYTLYLLLSAYARDLMGVRVVGSVNVALLLGIGQFAVTFALAWAFGRVCERGTDPLAERIRDRVRDEETVTGRVVGR
ncbi:DUF485 domain-containing protein [Nocardiopsis sp. LOL_012]|uniref:DUF485 domain-containing protein n=1 Tax=Nocardiopsis sp. LOL_012 TaxID=3345409 RepID=UPI003A8C87B8